MFYIRELGNELINGREDIDGVETVRYQLDSISAKWQDINLQATERQRHLEESIAKCFHRDVTALQKWLDETDKGIEIFVRQRPSEAEIEKYVKVLFHLCGCAYCMLNFLPIYFNND